MPAATPADAGPAAAHSAQRGGVLSEPEAPCRHGPACRAGCGQARDPAAPAPGTDATAIAINTASVACAREGEGVPHAPGGVVEPERQPDPGTWAQAAVLTGAGRAAAAAGATGYGSGHGHDARSATGPSPRLTLVTLAAAGHPGPCWRHGDGEEPAKAGAGAPQWLGAQLQLLLQTQGPAPAVRPAGHEAPARQPQGRQVRVTCLWPRDPEGPLL